MFCFIYAKQNTIWHFKFPSNPFISCITRASSIITENQFFVCVQKLWYPTSKSLSDLGVACVIWFLSEMLYSHSACIGCHGLGQAVMNIPSSPGDSHMKRSRNLVPLRMLMTKLFVAVKAF